MNFSELVELFNELDTTNQRSLLTTYVANYIKKAEGTDLQLSIYLILGTVFPENKEITLGIGESLLISALSQQSGWSEKAIKDKLAEDGDLGIVAETLLLIPKQMTIFKPSLILKTF